MVIIDTSIIIDHLRQSEAKTTALIHGAELYTLNQKHFAKINNLELYALPRIMSQT